MKTATAYLLTTLIAGLSHMPAGLAQGKASPLFDKPVAVKEVPPKSVTESEQARCTYFADLMIRDLTDGPTAVAPVLVSGTGMPCTLAAYPGGKTVDLTDMTFEGRKGRYLFFTFIDSHDTVGFAIVDAGTGRVLFKDSTFKAPPFTGMAVGRDGALTLAYNRGVSARCSLMQNAPKCWATLIKEGLIDRDLSAEAPDAKICANAYRKAKASKDNPSIITNTAEIMLAPDGTLKTLSRGKFGCDSAT